MAEGDFVIVKLSDIDTAIFDGIKDNKELRRAYDDFIDDVKKMWELTWEADMQGVVGGHPYQTGDYVAHIKKRKLARGDRTNLRKLLHQGIFIGMVYNDSEIAHFVEYGTGADAPGGHATWIGLDGERHFGPNTPTPEFAPMRKTAMAMEHVGEIT